MVEGTLNGHAFQAPLEPDGMGSHWFTVSNTMRKAAKAEVGDSVSVALEPMASWPEPKVPADLAEALASDPQAQIMDGHHASGALGLDPLDRLNQKPEHAHDPGRKDAFETQVRKAGSLLLQPQSMHRPFDVSQRRASPTNARSRKVRGAAGKIEKNLTHSMLAVHSVRIRSDKRRSVWQPHAAMPDRRYLYGLRA